MENKTFYALVLGALAVAAAIGSAAQLSSLLLHMTEARPVDVWAELGHGGKFGLASYPAAFSVANVEELVQPAEEEEQ